MEFWHGRGCHRDFDCAVIQVIRSEMWLSLTLDLRDAKSARAINQDIAVIDSSIQYLFRLSYICKSSVHRLTGTRPDPVSWSSPKPLLPIPSTSSPSLHISSPTDTVLSAAAYTYPRTRPCPSPLSPKSFSFPPQT